MSQVRVCLCECERARLWGWVGGWGAPRAFVVHLFLSHSFSHTKLKNPRVTTVCAATSGNHGRALAWGARLFGCRCRIYMGTFSVQQV